MKSLIICLIGLAVLLPGTAMADILIIANKNAPDAELSRKEVEKMFLSKLRQWSDKSRVHAVAVDVPAVHEAFLKQYLNKSTARYNAYWKRMVFTGKGVPPKSFNTEAELIAHVAETMGAIGYISSEGLPGGSESTIKIIKIK